MDENQTVVKGGAVAIKDGLIVALAAAAEVNAQYSAAEYVAGDNRIVMPRPHQRPLARGDDLAA